MELTLKPFVSTVYLLFAILIAACSATGPIYSKKEHNVLEGKSEIVVFRESKIGASGSSFCVKIDDDPIGILSNGGYLSAIVEPGKHSVMIPFKEGLELEVETKEGESKFILFTIGLASMYALPIGTVGVVSTSWNMSLVSTPIEYGLSETMKLREAQVTNDCTK